MARDAVERIRGMRRIAAADSMCRFVVENDAMPVRVVMRIDAMGHRQGDDCHKKDRGGPTRSPTQSRQHYIHTIEGE